ncbi:MAG: ammonium transporter [Chloroflexi bacterium]|nr:ammonium transporter [Chloroflexota bacterium]MDA1229106.1 ammonium transporter [Chloroflexota bacterium]
METLSERLRITTFRLRLMLMALLALGIFASSSGIAFAATTDEVEALLNDTILVFAAALVFFMQAGFAFLGAGLIRSKNTVNYMTKSFLDFCIASLGFWAFGFALMMGGSFAGVIGTDGFFLVGFGDTDLVGWLFQMVFAGTAATIIAGAMSERTNINAYFAYSFIVGALVYPIYGHWAWNEAGWLASMGMADFAGSGVVHMIGGMLALAGAIVVGPRIGFKEGVEFKGHNMAYVVIGTFILFFGWFGFNINSSSLGLNAVNTLLAGAAGATSAVYVVMLSTGKADLEMACNGALAGLVGITAGCAFVDPWAAVVIGLIAGVIMVYGVKFVKNILKADDPVGAVTVHGICGAWGLLAVGIFASGHNGVTGLIVGNAYQIVPQVVGILVAIAWGLGMGFIVFKSLDLTMGLRASREEELEGLDMPEHGALAYPEMAPVAGN